MQKSITVSQPNLANVNLYNNPLQQYLLTINKAGLSNCMVSSGNNLSNINNCVLSYIKGSNKIDDYNTNLVNLIPNNINYINDTNTTLEQSDINKLYGTNLTAYDINTANQFNNVKINLLGLQQSINSGNVDNAIINNIYAFDSNTNQFKNIKEIATNYTIDQSGKLIVAGNLQNFELIQKNSDYTNLYTLTLFILLILYFTVFCK
jgi:hypothetical protein